ncbi:hypothetical protein KC19_5G043700 [Ceratodon purpureus]|uniref:Uncharacterized protein n=1 Tax=Ceratodon purpureus TaxID=3225 RepID=A0A8T0HYV2_CERPU|nr:hypothetical protein KC19_5G043700 [Ceratodon purpureus]
MMLYETPIPGLINLSSTTLTQIRRALQIKNWSLKIQEHTIIQKSAQKNAFSLQSSAQQKQHLQEKDQQTEAKDRTLRCSPRTFSSRISNMPNSNPKATSHDHPLQQRNYTLFPQLQSPGSIAETKHHRMNRKPQFPYP